MWLYRRAVTFAFFNDDPSGHFAWMEGRSIWQFFTGSAEYGYYRPVVFVVLRLFSILFGTDVYPHSPAATHALLLLLHGANTFLVFALARRLSGRSMYALAAALVFAFLPFSYEAVGYVASLTHPLVVFWVLFALLAFDHAQTTGRRRYRVLALVAQVLGLLTHETGLFIFPALLGMDWVRRPSTTFGRRARELWPFAVVPIIFLALWLVVPKNSDQTPNRLNEIGRNILPFLQTLVYPLLPVARLGTGEVRFLLLLAVWVVGVSGWMAWLVGVLRLWCLAVAWFVLSSLPSLLFLSPAYVYGSPRLSYLPSIGVALLWAIPVLWLANFVGRRSRNSSKEDAGPRGKPEASAAVLTIAYILLAILPALPFIRCQLDFYAETSRFARGMASAASSAPAGRELVFINAPFFFSSTAARPEGCPSPYPWTPVGGVLIPPYAQARDFVRFNGGPDRPAQGVTFAGYGSGWRAFGPEIDSATLRDLASQEAPFVFDLLKGAFVDLAATWQPGGGTSAASPASFGDSLVLAGTQMQDAGELLLVELDWGVVGSSEAPLTAFVHVYDSSGALVAQHDAPPGDGTVPQTLWHPGDRIRQRVELDLSTLAPGSYTVAVGVYDAVTGVRLAAEYDDEPLADEIYRIGSFNR